MKKTIPFDLDKAKAGAKVVTNTGQEVTILTYEGRDNERPIIGTFMHADYEPGKGIGTAEEILDRWPVNGVNIHPGGYDLLIEEEETPKGWYIKGEALCKDGQPIATLFIAHHNAMDKEDLLHRIAIALNGAENTISEVDYEEEENPVVTMSREDWVKTRERLEFLETENEEIKRGPGKTWVPKEKVETLEEEVRKWAHDCNAKQKEIDKLKAQRAQVIEHFKKWREVKNFFNAMAKRESI